MTNAVITKINFDGCDNLSVKMMYEEDRLSAYDFLYEDPNYGTRTISGRRGLGEKEKAEWKKILRADIAHIGILALSDNLSDLWYRLPSDNNPEMQCLTIDDIKDYNDHKSTGINSLKSYTTAKLLSGKTLTSSEALYLLTEFVKGLSGVRGCNFATNVEKGKEQSSLFDLFNPQYRCLQIRASVSCDEGGYKPCVCTIAKDEPFTMESLQTIANAIYEVRVGNRFKDL